MINALQMSLHGLSCHCQDDSDLLVCLALGQPIKDFGRAGSKPKEYLTSPTPGWILGTQQEDKAGSLSCILATRI